MDVSIFITFPLIGIKTFMVKNLTVFSIFVENNVMT